MNTFFDYNKVIVIKQMITMPVWFFHNIRLDGSPIAIRPPSVYKPFAGLFYFYTNNPARRIPSRCIRNDIPCNWHLLFVWMTFSIDNLPVFDFHQYLGLVLIKFRIRFYSFIIHCQIRRFTLFHHHRITGHDLIIAFRCSQIYARWSQYPQILLHFLHMTLSWKSHPFCLFYKFSLIKQKEQSCDCPSSFIHSSSLL